jgi:hypothetical protein
MQGLWYGDKRDRVKWGALVYLAKEQEISCIVQVAYFRHGPDLKLQINEFGVEREVELPQEVWDHFSDLRHIERLGKATNLKIIVLDQEFKQKIRPNYISDIVTDLANIKCRKIVFLDPNTGIEPKNRKPEHVAIEDIQTIWKALSVNDLLVIYQHSDRTLNWLPDREKTMCSACGGVDIKTITGKGIASDVAMLWCLKDLVTKSVTDSESTIGREPPTKITEAAPKPGTCPCGCGEEPRKGTFVPGHDGRVSGWIRQIEKKEKKISDFPAINGLYAAWVRAGKPGGNHPRLAGIFKKSKNK